MCKLSFPINYKELGEEFKLLDFSANTEFHWKDYKRLCDARFWKYIKSVFPHGTFSFPAQL